MTSKRQSLPPKKQGQATSAMPIKARHQLNITPLLSLRDLNGGQTDLKIFSDNDNNLQDIDPDQYFSSVNMDCKYCSNDDFKTSC